MFSSSWFSRRRRPGPRVSYLKAHRAALLSAAAAVGLVTLALWILYASTYTQEQTTSSIVSPFINGPPVTPPAATPPALPLESDPPLPPTPPIPPSPIVLPPQQPVPSASTQTPAEAECSRRLGSGLLERWTASEAPYVVALTPEASPAHPPLPCAHSVVMPLHAGSLSCASITIPNMPPPTAPHSYCQGSHVYLFLASLTPAQAPKHRPGYAFGTMQHYHYKPGALALVGRVTEQRDLSRLCGDHMRDSVEAVSGEAWDTLYGRLQVSGERGRMALCERCTLLLVTREGGEHVNLYHTMTDWYNAFLMLHAHGLAAPSSLANVRLLFLDNHPPGYLDPLWQTVFTPSYPLLRVSNLTARGVDALYAPRALLVPAGYSSPIWVHLRDDDPCKDEVDLVARFAAFVKAQLGLSDHPLSLPLLQRYYPDPQPPSTSKAPYAAGVISQHTVLLSHPSSAQRPVRVLHIVLISRRPYRTATVDHSHINRRILNEPQLVEALLSVPDSFHPQHFTHFHLSFVDFAQIAIQHQLALVSTADLLIGVHGAALSHAIFLPAKGALLELQPAQQNWRIFQHMQQWAHRQDGGEEGGGEQGGLWKRDAVHGANYGEWRNSVPGRERKDDVGDGIEVDVAEVKAEVIRLLSWRDRREGSG